MEFNWENHRQDLNVKVKELVKKHNTFLKSDIGQFLKSGVENYATEWVCVLWWNSDMQKIECYDKENIFEAQALIDFYHFSVARTKVILRYSGEDVTRLIKFNPLYRDIFVDTQLQKRR